MGLRKFDVVLHERKHGIVRGKYLCITCGHYFISVHRFQQHLSTYKHEGTEVQFEDVPEIGEFLTAAGDKETMDMEVGMDQQESLVTTTGGGIDSSAIQCSFATEIFQQSMQPKTEQI